MTDNKNKPSIIFVLGMHRSGTSLVAQMVAKWGAYMGNNLMKADWYNQDGYWEYNPLVTLHEKMLAYTGNTWYAPPESIDVAHLINVFGNEARVLIDEMDKESIIWSWKDPRMAIFLPFWQELLKDRELLYVYSYRNPLSIAVSLKTRDSIPTITTTALWEIYTLKIFEALKSTDACFFVQYENLIDKPDELTKQLFDFLNTQLHEQRGSDILNKMRAAIKPGLKHSLPPQNISIDKQQANLYTLLQHEQIPEKGIEYLHTRLNYALEITDLYHKGNSYKERNLQLQLFYKHKGKSYSEEDSFIKRYEPNTQQLVFEFDELSDIEFLRFDPLTDWVQCICGELDLYYNYKHVATLQAVSHNATKVFADSLFFALRDPQVYFKTDRLEDVLFNKAVIRFQYLRVGTQCKTYFAENPALFFDDLFLINEDDKQNNNSLISLHRQLYDKIQGFENRINQSKALIKQKEKIIEDITGQIEELEERTSTKREKILVLESRFETIEQQYRAISEELESNKQQNTKLIRDLNSANRQIESLQHELENKQQTLQKATNRENQQLETIKKYQKQNMELSQKLHHKEQQIQAERTRLQHEIKNTNDTLKHLMANERNKLVRNYHWRLPLRLAGNLWRFIKHPMAYYRMRRDTLIVRRSGLFDDGWYLQQYPDLYLTTVDMLQHYMLYGAAEGRNPNPMFDAQYYLKENPDVKEAGYNPLLHYVLYGEDEGRKPNQNFDPKFYLDANPDVKKARISPLLHYVLYGKNEDRKILKKDCKEEISKKNDSRFCAEKYTYDDKCIINC
ncbi:MAG: sulfotransferase [Prolixibacteraceae bacterium]|nr:sulfotransferase [Prolixibacteraceae bacterium]